MSVPNSAYCSSSRQTSLPMCVRTQFSIPFQQQADVITNVCSYPILYTVLVAGRRHFQCVFVPNSVYCSRSRQTSLPMCVRTQLCVLFQQQAEVITIVCPYPTLYAVLVACTRHYHCVSVSNSVYCSSSRQTSLPMCVRTQLCILFQQQADVITNICPYPTLHTILVAGRRDYQYMSVPNSVYCSSSRQTSLPIYVRTQLCILFQQQADVITNICPYPTLHTILVAGRRHYQYMSVPNSVYCSSSRQTSLPIYVRTQLCIPFQQQADVITNICPYPTLYTVLVAGRRHYQYMSVPNSLYYSSSRQTSLPIYVRTQLCILFQQQADVITNICSYPPLYTVLVAGRRHYQYMFVPNSAYYSSSRQTSLPIYVRTQLCILFQQQADVITNICSYPTLYTVLVAGRRHYQYMFVPYSVYCSSSRQTSLPIYVRTQLCILLQQQADVITNICSYPTLHTVLVAGRRHYQYMSVPNSAYCSSSRQTSLPMCVRTQLCMLFQQHADVTTNVCSNPTLYTVLVTGRRHYQYMFVPNSVYCSSSRQTSLPIYVRTQLCILFQQQADVITNICPYPTLHTILVAGRRHYQYMFASNSVYCSSSRQTSLPIYVRIQLCILFQQQADVITNICSYPNLYTILVAGRRHYEYMSVPNSAYCSSSRQTSLPIYVRPQLCILFQQQADLITNICSYPTLYTVLAAGRRHYQYMFVPNSVYCSSSRQTSLPICVRTQLCILFQQQADVITNICSYPTLYTAIVAGRRHYQYMFVPNSAYCSSSRQTSLPIYVCTQLCILFQQQTDVITNVCPYPTLYAVLVACTRHYHCVSVSNSVYCSSSRQTPLPMCVRTQLFILFQQHAHVITNICPYPTLYTVLVAGRRHYQYMFVPNSVYCSSSRQTSLPIYVRTQLCILFQQQADVITNICPYPTLYTVLVAGRRHYQYMFVPNSVYCSSSRQTSLPIYVRTQLCILFQQQADVITNICSYPTLYTAIVAGRRHYQYMFVPKTAYCSSSRQTSLPIYVCTQLCILFQQQADVITNVCPYPTLYAVLVACTRHYHCVSVSNSVYCSSSRQTSLPMCVRTQLCILFQQQADVITNICSYPTLYTVLVAGRRHYQYMSVPNSAYCSSSRQTSLPIYVRTQLCILFQQQADVITNICSYPTLYTVLVAGRRHYQYMFVSNSVYCSSSRQTLLPIYVRIQLCILFQQQADVITNICPYPTLHTVLVAGRRHYQYMSVPNSVYYSSSRQTSLPIYVRIQLCILFQQQADVITNICSYPTLYTVLVAGRRHYQYVFVPNSVYCSSSRQTSLPIYVRTQLCILLQQQADVITNICSYPTLHTVLVAGRRHYQYMSVPNSAYCSSSRQTSLPMCVRTQLCMLFQQHAHHYHCVSVSNSVYCSSSRQTSLPMCVRTQLCILFQQQADVITNICSYPTLYTVLVAGRRHYQYMSVPNSAYCSSSRQTSLPIYVRIQLCILFQQQVDVIINKCSYPTLYTVLVAGRRHYQYMFVSNSVYYSSSRQTSLPIYVRTQLCILFQQQADVITNICPSPTLYTILVAGRRHYQYMFVSNSVYYSSSRQTSLPIYVRTQLCILFQQQADVITNICSYPTLHTILVAGRRHYQYMFVPNSVYCSSSRQTSLPIYVRTQLCILFQYQADVITNICSYQTQYTVLVAGRRHYQYMFVPNSVYCYSSRQTSLPIYVRTQLCILFQQQADVITNICLYPILHTVLVAGRRHYQCVSVPNSVCCSSSMHTSLPLCVPIQLCILFQQQADVITNICSYPTLYTVLVAGRRHYQYMSVPNSAYCSSSRQTSLPIYVRTQLCILFYQQADVITNIYSYPTLYTVLVAGRRHYQYMFVSNSVYCSSISQTLLPIYVRIQLCILFQQQADVIINICPYPTLHTVLVAGRRHYQYMSVPNSVYYSSSRQTSLPIYVRIQLCILFQQQADVITNICSYPTLYTVLVAGRRHYQYMFVPNSVYCSSSRQTSLPIYVRTQLCILLQQQADVITNICSYPTLHTVLVAGRRHYQYMSVPNSAYCSSSRQTSFPMCVRTQLCMLFQQHAHVITIVCPYPTLYTVLVAGRRHYQCVFVPNSVYCSSSRQTSLPIYVRTQLCILFQQQVDVTTNICPYPTLHTVLVAGRRHYQYMSVPNSIYYSSSRQTSLPIYVRIQLCILFQQQVDVFINKCSYPTLYTVLVAGRRHYQYMFVSNSVYYSSSRQTSLPIYVRTQLCILFQQQADVITNICPSPTLYTILVAGRRHYQYMFVSNSVYCSSSRQTSLPIYVRIQLCILF